MSREVPPRPAPRPRAAYRAFRPIPTRWADNDAYGHVNNVVYYAWFDTAVNGLLVARGLLDIEGSPAIGLVAETGCTYLRSLAFPQAVEVGLVVDRLGGSSITWGLGVFAAGAEAPAAQGRFVHVYVDRATRRPAPVPEATRTGLADLVAG